MENIKITPENYYQDKTHFTNSMLQDFLKNEYYFKLKHLDKEQEPEREVEAFIYGTAVDDYFSEGEDFFNSKYQEVARRSKEADTRVVELTQAVYRNVMESIVELRNQPLFTNFAKEKDTNFQTILIGEIEGLPFKGKLDLFNERLGRIGDMKTTANIKTFNARDYGMQMALYRELARQMYNKKFTNELYVVDKNSEWKRSACFKFSDEVLDEYWEIIKGAVQRLKACIESGLFDVGDRYSIYDLPLYNKMPQYQQQEFIIVN